MPQRNADDPPLAAPALTMPYARHRPRMEHVLAVLQGDLAATVEFFGAVDAAKPAAAELLARGGYKKMSALDLVRANEAALVEAIEKRLAERQGA